MKKLILVAGALAAVLVLALVLAIWRPWQSTYDRHFATPLPATAKLLHHDRRWGRDFGNAFEFSFTDNALRDQIIAEWGLRPVGAGGQITTFLKYHGPTWWPVARLDALPEKYSRVDDVRCDYWSLWIDRDSQRIYAEYGNW